MFQSSKTFATVSPAVAPPDREATRHTGPLRTPTSSRALGRKSSPRGATATQVKTKNRRTGAAQKILVVDDVTDVTEMIALFLKHAGFEVKTANSADMALRMTSESQFDLIISDIGMPEKNGYELAESLRGSVDYKSTPMIAVTGYTEYDDRGRSLRAGFDAHLTKPINPSHLLEIIGQLLD